MQSIWKRKKNSKILLPWENAHHIVEIECGNDTLRSRVTNTIAFQGRISRKKCSTGRRLKKNGFAGHSSLFLGRNMMLFIHFNSFKSWIFAEKQHENPIFSIFCLYFSISYSNAGRMFETPALGLEVLHDLHPVTIYLSLESPEYLNSILS